MAEIGCSLATDINYFKLPTEKGNIQKNRCCRILDNGSGHLFTPCDAYCIFFEKQFSPVPKWFKYSIFRDDGDTLK